MTAAFLIALALAIWFAVGWMRAAGENARRESQSVLIIYGRDFAGASMRERQMQAKRVVDSSRPN
jgi:hypothetical protein